MQMFSNLVPTAYFQGFCWINQLFTEMCNIQPYV